MDCIFTTYSVFVNRSVKTSLLLFIGALLLFVPFIGTAHLFDWDEINFAECAREMVVTGDYSTVRINYEPFWEKPPLFIWMQALAMKAFGAGDFAARLPNAVCGAFTVLFLYHVGRKVYDHRFALIWVLAYVGSLLPHFYFRSGIIDPWFNLFIFAGVWFFAVFVHNNQPYHSKLPLRKELFLSGIALGLAILTKGPAAMVVFGLVFLVFVVKQKGKPFMSIKQFVVIALTVIATGSIWFIIEIFRGRSNVIVEFFVYQVRLFTTEDAGHGGPFYYHLLVLLIGCFPIFAFALRGFIGGKSTGMLTPWEAHVGWWMKALLLTVLILFSYVETKIIHYSSLTYFPLTFIGARTIYRIHNGELTWKRWMTWMVAVTGGVWIIGFTVVPQIDRFKKHILDAGLVKDRFAAGNLEATANWNGWEWLPGLVLFAGLVWMLWKLKKNIHTQAAYIILGSTLVATSLASGLLAPRVEEYSQGSAVRFYESLQDKNVFVETLGFKSYAQYYYSRVQPGLAEVPAFVEWKNQNSKSYADPKRTLTEINISMQRDWMLRGNIDRPMYFVCKNTFESEVAKYYPHLRKLKEENGFVFWERLPGY